MGKIVYFCCYWLISIKTINLLVQFCLKTLSLMNLFLGLNQNKFNGGWRGTTHWISEDFVFGDNSETHKSYNLISIICLSLTFFFLTPHQEGIIHLKKNWLQEDFLWAVKVIKLKYLSSKKRFSSLLSSSWQRKIGSAVDFVS